MSGAAWQICERCGWRCFRVAALAAFDAESRRIREAAGCARRST